MASNRLPVDSWVIRKSPEQIAEEPTMEHIGFAPDDDEFSSPIGGDYQGGCLPSHPGLGLSHRTRSPRPTNVA